MTILATRSPAFQMPDSIDWEQLAAYRPGYTWDRAWESALATRHTEVTERAMDAARRAGAGQGAAALFAAAATAIAAGGELDPADRATLIAPLVPASA